MDHKRLKLSLLSIMTQNQPKWLKPLKHLRHPSHPTLLKHRKRQSHRNRLPCSKAAVCRQSLQFPLCPLYQRYLVFRQCQPSQRCPLFPVAISVFVGHEPNSTT